MNQDGSYKVIFDDGDVVEAVRPEEVRPSTAAPASQPDEHSLTPGTRVVCKLGDWDAFYPGTVEHVNTDNSCKIAFDDGDVVERVPSSDIQLPEDIYLPGTQIYYKTEGTNDYLPVTIVSIDEDNTYTVATGTGEKVSKVPLSDTIKRVEVPEESGGRTHSFQVNDCVVYKGDSNAVVKKVVEDGKYVVQCEGAEEPRQATIDDLWLKEEPQYKVGDRITCRIPMWDRAYPGKIESISPQRLFTVLFDDNEVVQNVHPIFIHQEEAASKQNGRKGRFNVADRVQAKLDGWDKYYEGTIKAVGANAKYNILFDDGDFCDQVTEDVMKTGRPEPFARGSRVLATIPAWKQHYPGRIECVNLNGTYDILFDDGDTQIVEHADILPENSKSEVVAEDGETAPEVLEQCNANVDQEVGQPSAAENVTQPDERPSSPDAQPNEKRDKASSVQDTVPIAMCGDETVPKDSVNEESQLRDDESVPLTNVKPPDIATASMRKPHRYLSSSKGNVKPSKPLRNELNLDSLLVLLKLWMRRGQRKPVTFGRLKSLLNSTALDISEKEIQQLLESFKKTNHDLGPLDLQLRVVARRPQQIRRIFEQTDFKNAGVFADGLVSCVKAACNVVLSREDASLIVDLHNNTPSGRLRAEDLVRLVLPDFGLNVMTPTGLFFMPCDPTWSLKQFKAHLKLRSHKCSSSNRLNNFEIAKHFGHVLIKPPAYNSSMSLHETLNDKDIVYVLADTMQFVYTNHLRKQQHDEQTGYHRASQKSKVSVESKRLRKMFDLMDLNGDGVIQLRELETALAQKPRVKSVLIGSQRLKALIESPTTLFAKMDQNGDGLITFEELLLAVLPDHALPNNSVLHSAKSKLEKNYSSKALATPPVSPVSSCSELAAKQVPLDALSHNAIERIRCTKGIPKDMQRDRDRFAVPGVEISGGEDPSETQQWVNSKSSKQWLGLHRDTASSFEQQAEHFRYNEDLASIGLSPNPYTWSKRDVRTWLVKRVELPKYAADQFENVSMSTLLLCTTNHDLKDLGFNDGTEKNSMFVLHQKKLLVHLEEIRKASRDERGCEMDEWRMADVIDWLSRDL